MKRLPRLLAFVLLAAACAPSGDRSAQNELTCAQQALEVGEIFHEDWDGCIAGWRTRDGQAVSTVTDSVASERNLVEKLTHSTDDSSGTMYSSWLSLVPVTGGTTYCLGAWVRWAGGNAPFVGIRRYDVNQVDLGVDERLIAYAGADASVPAGSAFLAPTPGGYRFYHASFTVPANTGYLQVLDGLDADVNLGGGELATYVDVLNIRTGVCAQGHAEISISGNLTAWATSPLGANLTYSASAADGTGAPVPVTCTPGSGALFPIGTTTITCTAGSGPGLTTKSVDARVLTWNRGGVRSALIVVPASGAGTLEQQVAARLQGLGLEATTMSQAVLTATSVVGRTLVVVMPGVDGATIKPSLLTAHAPVLVLEPTALDDLGMVGTVSGTDFGTAANTNEIAITQSTHPLAAGLAGLAWVYSSAGSLGWGKPASTAATVATVVGQSAQSTIFGYLTGVQMVGQVATARRAGLFMTRTVGDGVSSVGWQFFDAAVKWLATPEVLLIVADSTALNASDIAIKARLALLGFDAVVMSDEKVVATDGDGREAVVISGSVVPSAMTANLSAARTPIVVLQPGVLGTLGMTGTVSGTDYGTQASQSVVSIVQASHPLAAGQHDQPRVIQGTLTATFGWGKPASAGLVIADISGSTTKMAVFGYEAGAQMTSGLAPARRVGLFATADANNLSDSGWALFDASIRWATRPMAIVITGRTTVAPADSAVRGEIERLGYGVAATTAPVADADLLAKSLVVVTGIATPTNVPAVLVTSPVPMLVTQGGCYSTLKMTSSSSYGSVAGQKQITITAPTHPLAAGRSGNVTVSADLSSVTWGTPASSTLVVATVLGNATQPAIFGYPGGTALVGGDQAPGRRVGWFGTDTAFLTLNPVGWQLFDAAVLWAGGWTSGGGAQRAACPGMFCDDFEVGNADRWTLRRDATVGDFSVVSDGTKVYRQANPATTGWRVSQAGAYWGDQVIEARMKVLGFAGSSSSYMAGLYGRYDWRPGQGCAYYIGLHGNGQMALHKLVGTTDSTIGTAVSAGIVAGKWYALRLEIVGTTLAAYLDGVLKLSGTDSSCTSGGVAVGSQGASFEVDDVLVMPASKLTTVSMSFPAGLSCTTVGVGANGALRLADSTTVTTVKNGDGSMAPISNAGPTETTVGRSGQSGDLTSVASVTLRDYSTVSGNLKTGGTLTRQNGTTVTGTITQNATLTPLAVQSWTVHVPVAKIGDVVLQPDAVGSAGPGSYGQMTVNSRARLSLTAGAYYLTGLDVEPQGILSLDKSLGPIVIYVTGTVILNNGTIVNAGGAESDFLLVYLGSTAFSVNQAFTGSIVAPNIDLTLATVATSHRGSFYAHDIDIAANNKIVVMPFPWNRLLGACSGEDAMPRPSGTACRPSASACDAPETCDGATYTCAQDNPLPAGTPCDDGSMCTQTDTCQGWTCTGGNPVVCTASDQCHNIGTCDPATGACSNPAKTNGTTCNDGNACTQTDTCQNGMCTGGNPVVCTPSDQCHASTCDPANGQCVVSVKPDGTTCSDGNGCTQVDTCQAAVCTGSNPVVCTASDQCHVAGICAPATGVCSNPAKDNGVLCNDGNACTRTDTCQGGTCTGGNPVVCTASDQCHNVGTCDTATGVCSNPAKTNGTTCTDGNACTVADTCQAGVCQSGTLNTCSGHGTCNTGTGACTCTGGYTGSDCSIPPCTTPGAPTAVTATAASGKVTLSWTAPSGGAASYNILRSTTKGSGYSSIGTATTTSFVNSGLTNGVQYYYVVQASNGASCNSVYSREKVCGGGIYCDDFESGTAPNWTVSNGTFAVSLSSGNYVYKQTQTGSTTAGRYAYKASSTANYTVQALVRVTQFGNTTSSSRAGVAARYSNSTTSYTFGLAGNNTLTLQKGYATAISNCAAIAFTVSTNTWYALKIVVSGTSIKTYVNGTLKHSCTDSGVAAANSAALFTGSGGTPGTLADFDDAFIY